MGGGTFDLRIQQGLPPPDRQSPRRAVPGRTVGNLMLENQALMTVQAGDQLRQIVKACPIPTQNDRRGAGNGQIGASEPRLAYNS